jgi:hypothetical protein
LFERVQVNMSNISYKNNLNSLQQTLANISLGAVLVLYNIYLIKLVKADEIKEK